jgi:L-fucose mutarotase
MLCLTCITCMASFYFDQTVDLRGCLSQSPFKFHIYIALHAGHERVAIVLKGISSLLNSEVLGALRAMGHGDDLVVVDTNFPAASVARHTHVGHVLRIDNVSAAQAIEAILSVYPLDTFVDDAAARMEIVGAPSQVPVVQQEVQDAINQAEGKVWPLVSVERYAFYERAKKAYCVIQTGERRFYGCFALRKGVIAPDA